MTEQEKRLRRDVIIKIRNYIDCFSDNEIIQSMCGNPILFKEPMVENAKKCKCKKMQKVQKIQKIQKIWNLQKKYKRF